MIDETALPVVTGRALVIGTGPVGRGYYAVLTAAGATARLVDSMTPGQPGLALESFRPHLVVVAVPPRPAMELARTAAATGAVVLVAAPAALVPDAIHLAGLNSRIFLALEHHFCAGVAPLLRTPDRLVSAVVTVRCHRYPAFYRGWRSSIATGGGALHGPAFAALATITRLAGGGSVTGRITASARMRSGTHSQVEVSLEGAGQFAQIAVGVDVDTILPDGSEPHCTVRFLTGTKVESVLSGATWLAGIGHPAHAEHQRVLRGRLCAAAMNLAAAGTWHPSLFPIQEVRPTLRLINAFYSAAGGGRGGWMPRQ